jgi:hypothetical protein
LGGHRSPTPVTIRAFPSARCAWRRRRNATRSAIRSAPPRVPPARGTSRLASGIARFAIRSAPPRVPPARGTSRLASGTARFAIRSRAPTRVASGTRRSASGSASDRARTYTTSELALAPSGAVAPRSGCDCAACPRARRKPSDRAPPLPTARALVQLIRGLRPLRRCAGSPPADRRHVQGTARTRPVCALPPARANCRDPRRQGRRALLDALQAEG